MAAGLQSLKCLARIYKQSAFATSSQKTYRSQMKCYLNFCLEFHCMPVPCSQETLICYTAFLSKKMLPGSIANYLNAVRVIHVESGHPNPLSDNYELVMLKRGIARLKGIPPKQKQPMTLDLLIRVRSSVNLILPSDLSFGAICVLGFFGFLRKSTLLPASPSVCPDKMLTRGDIIDFDLESFVLVVRFSKVIQFGQKILKLPYYMCVDPKLCPVRAILAHFGASPLGKDRPLFNFLRDGVEVFMSPGDFVKRLKSALLSVGVDQTEYSAHSLRRGGASYAFEIGISPLQIKQRGDWASSAYEKYIFVSANSLSAVGRALSSGVTMS